jgi:hypothetical protein
MLIVALNLIHNSLNLVTLFCSQIHLFGFANHLYHSSFEERLHLIAISTQLQYCIDIITILLSIDFD